MKFTKEQVLSFSTNWKQFHAKGLHKAKPVVRESGFPVDSRFYFAPQIHMKSDLSFVYHILYNYLRNLPLERGVNVNTNFPYNIHALYRDDNLEFQYIDIRIKNSAGNPANIERLIARRIAIMRMFTSIFGDEITEDILMEFIEEIKAYEYEPD